MPGATAARSSSSPPPSPPQPPAEAKKTLAQHLRFYLVWTARVLLPIVFALSLAKPVVIPAPPGAPAHSRHDASGPHLPEHVIPLLVITHSRAQYLQRCLASVLAHHPGAPNWPVIVSRDQQDMAHAHVDAAVDSFVTRFAARNITLLSWVHAFNYAEDDATKAADAEHPFVDMRAYRRISRHYAWALRRVFSGTDVGGAPTQIVILEDDMEVAPDFFGYFNALRPLLLADKSLLCVSAWNDNGVASLSHDAEQLHRTDFFPGLGWMLTRSLWAELAPKWPEVFWDDWLRRGEQTRGRQCVRPEVSRVANFGETGVSQSFHFTKHVSQVVRSNGSVPFEQLDLSYLAQEQYHAMFFSRLANATRLRFSNYLTTRPADGDVVAFYPEEHLEPIGKRTGIMIDHRNGVRRTSYHGVIVIPWNGHWAFIVKRGWEPPEGYTLGARDCC